MKQISALIAAILICFTSCRGQPDSIMSLEEIFKSRGAPSFMASGFDITTLPSKLVQARLYEVTQDVRNASPKDIPAGRCLVFSSDKGFNQYAKYHFLSMNNPEEYTGSTMFSTLYDEGTPIEIISLDAEGRGKVSFKGKIHIAFIEVGAKGHLIRQAPKRPGAKEAKK